MAIDYIKIDPTQSAATHASLLLQYIATLRQAYELANKTLAIMSHNNDGTTFTNLELLFGIPTGKGQTIFNFVNGSAGTMVGSFQTADVKNLTETVG